MDKKDWKDSELAWALVGAAAAVVAGVAVRKSIELGWRAVKHEDPPNNPASPDTALGQALAWSALMGLSMGIARMLGRRTATSGWRRVIGNSPPGLRRKESRLHWPTLRH